MKRLRDRGRLRLARAFIGQNEATIRARVFDQSTPILRAALTQEQIYRGQPRPRVIAEIVRELRMRGEAI